MWTLGDGYYEIHCTSLSTLMLENFPKKGVLKNYRWQERVGEGRRRGFKGQDGRPVLWCSLRWRAQE